MKVAVIGSKGLVIRDLEELLPRGTKEIVLGGAQDIAKSVRECLAAYENDIKLVEFLPDYEQYGDDAPVQRDMVAVKYSDIVLAFWDGKSIGTKFVIDYCNEHDIPVRVFV